MIKLLGYLLNHFNPTLDLFAAKRYLSQLYNSYHDESQMKAKSDLCEELLRVFDILDPGLSQTRGFTLFQLALAQMALQKLSGQESLKSKIIDNLRKACECLRFEPEGTLGHSQRLKAEHLLKPL